MTSASRDAGRARTVIVLKEWETRKPDALGPGAPLHGLTLGDDPAVKLQVDKLAQAGIVTITELRDGLRIDTTSYVGHLAIGAIDIKILPKVAWPRWLTLFGYALRLRDITRSQAAEVNVETTSLNDLVVSALLTEARELVNRGIHREYELQRRTLTVPRGRMDFARIARQGGLTDARIPSRFTRRSDDTTLNRLLLAALHAAVRVSTDVDLRVNGQRLAQELATTVTAVPLTVELLENAANAIDRRTLRYGVTLRIAELLRTGTAVTIDAEHATTLDIPGFAFDMNALWQRLLGRVLSEWTSGVRVAQEFTLRQIFRADPVFAPRRRGLPRPRPDFAVFRQGSGVLYLDAKYRDLWETALPREMLYQVALYAMAQRDGAAAMLYPTESPGATEERFAICSPIDGTATGCVALRPVDLGKMEELIAQPPSLTREKRRATFARTLLGT